MLSFNEDIFDAEFQHDEVIRRETIFAKTRLGQKVTDLQESHQAVIDHTIHQFYKQ